MLIRTDGIHDNTVIYYTECKSARTHNGPTIKNIYAPPAA